MLRPDILLEIHHARRQELLRDREHDQLVAQARQSAPPHQWRLRLARGLHGIAARIECSAEHSVTGLQLRTDT
jgi:hypothetical protein